MGSELTATNRKSDSTERRTNVLLVLVLSWDLLAIRTMSSPSNSTKEQESLNIKSETTTNTGLATSFSMDASCVCAPPSDLFVVVYQDC